MQNNLNNRLWNGFELKPKVQETLRKISDAFLKFIDIKNIDVLDIIFIGSMANYDYHDKSDIDIHIIVDFSKYDENKKMMIELLDAKKKIWNDNHKITIFGHDVEIYVENSNDPQPSTGKYSILYKKWIIKPTKESKEIDKKTISIKCKNLIKKIEHFKDQYDKNTSSTDLISKIESFIDRLKEKRKSGIESQGIFSQDNIIYKYLRKNGYLDDLIDIKRKLFDNSLTLEQLTENIDNKKLYFTVSISGMGKSTYVNKVFDKKLIVCPDNIRKEVSGDISNQSNESDVWSIVRNRLSSNLEKYGIAVLDATNVDSHSRGLLLNDFPNPEKIALVFKPNIELAKRRIKSDLELGKDRSNVPDHVIDNQYNKFIKGYNDLSTQFDKVVIIN